MVRGHSDGPAARFNYPHGIAVDAQDGVLIADSFNHCIRHLAPDGAQCHLSGARELPLGQPICSSETCPHCCPCSLRRPGTVTTLAASQPGANCVAVDATTLYWTNYDGGSVMKAPKGGGSATLIAFNQDVPDGITVDGTSVYWTNYEGGTVMKAPK